MLKRFYLLLLIFSAAVLSPVLIFPVESRYNAANILFLIYLFLPALSLLILYRDNLSDLWEELNFSKGENSILSILKSLLFWNALFYGSLLLATFFGFYSWDFEQGGLSAWISNKLNAFSDANQVPIPPLPFTAKQMAHVGISASLSIPFLAFPFFFLQEIVWRSWLPQQYKEGSITELLMINGIWGLWHIPLILAGRIYSAPLLGIPAILISCTLQGTLLCLITKKTGSIFSATVARGFLFSSAPLVIIFHESGSTTNPLVIGLYGVFSWVLMSGVIFWFVRRDETMSAS